MIRIVFFQDAQGIAGFEASGHAGYARAGQDIVCAGVSAILQAACVGLVECGDGRTAPAEIARARRSSRRGYLRLMLRRGADARCLADAQLILRVARAGTRAIAVQYPEFVRLRNVRLRNGKSSGTGGQADD